MKFNLSAAVSQPGYSNASAGCYSKFLKNGDQGSLITTAIAFRTRVLPRGIGFLAVDKVSVVLKLAPGSPVRKNISDYYFAFYLNDPLTNSPGTLVGHVSPVIPVSGSVIRTTFSWFSINVSTARLPPLNHNTTYWFALLPPIARVVLPSFRSVNGVLLGGVYDPDNTLSVNMNNVLFTTVELSSERWSADGLYNCARKNASTWLQSQVSWFSVISAVSRFHKAFENPLGVGPLRMGIDVSGFHIISAVLSAVEFSAATPISSAVRDSMDSGNGIIDTTMPMLSGVNPDRHSLDESTGVIVSIAAGIIVAIAAILFLVYQSSITRIVREAKHRHSGTFSARSTQLSSMGAPNEVIVGATNSIVLDRTATGVLTSTNTLMLARVGNIRSSRLTIEDASPKCSMVGVDLDVFPEKDARVQPIVYDAPLRIVTIGSTAAKPATHRGL